MAPHFVNARAAHGYRRGMATDSAARPARATDPLDPVRLAIDLMRIDSTSGREGEVIAYVHQLLEGRGWRVRRIAVSDGRDDLFAAAVEAPLVRAPRTSIPFRPTCLRGRRTGRCGGAARATPRGSPPP